MKIAFTPMLSFLLCLLCFSAVACTRNVNTAPYGKWSRGINNDESYFPISVWLQSPSNAARYKAAGVNLYIGLWGGPTAEQIAQLKAADMPVICDMNDWAKQNLDEPAIVGWMHGDEPDNAQLIDKFWKNDREEIRRQWPEYSADQIAKMTGYGPGISPSVIQEDYRKLVEADPSRPVMLNLGQSVAYTDWGGRGVRSGHTEDYPQYVRGGDIISFDIYPANHSRAKYNGQLWYVPFGVSRLDSWGGGRKIIWQCVEASPITFDTSDTPAKPGSVKRNHVPTGREMKNEIWSSIIHGSNGIIYFMHQFSPSFNEAYIFSNEELLKDFTAINFEIQALAPVINSPTIDNLASVWCADSKVPVKTMAKLRDGYIYIFASAMRQGSTEAVFELPGIAADAEVEVIGENRTLSSQRGIFADQFSNWDVHLYKVKSAVRNPRDNAMMASFRAMDTDDLLDLPTIDNIATVRSDTRAVSVKVIGKIRDGYIYLFAAAMHNGSAKMGSAPANASFELFAIAEDSEVEVVGENRTLTCQGRTFTDKFTDGNSHLYKIKVDGFEGFSK